MADDPLSGKDGAAMTDIPTLSSLDAEPPGPLMPLREGGRAVSGWDTDEQGRPTKDAVGEIVRDYGAQAVAFMAEKFGLPQEWCEQAVQAVLHPNGDTQRDEAPHPADDPAAFAALVASGRPGLNGHHPAPEDPDEMILAAIPEYPVKKLHGPLREFVDWAVRDGLLAPAAGAAGLSALATVCGYAELEFCSTVIIRPALWLIPIGGPGTGKSPARHQAFKPIERLYTAERQEWRRNCQTVKEQNAQLRQQREQATRGGVTGADAPFPQRPEPLTLTDANMPVVARWLEAGGGAGTLAYDEVKALVSGLTTADRAKMMEAWTARDALHIQRVGQGGDVNAIDIYVERPVLGIFGPLTLKDLNLLGQEGDGFRSRWLPHIVKGKARMLDAGPPPPSWAAVLERLYRARELRTWHLGTDAANLYKEAKSRWEKEQEEPYPPGVIEALRKAETQCLRICLPLAESTYKDGRRVISADVMTAAVALTDYALDCWKALPGGSVLTLGYQDEKLVAATDELLAWLEDRPAGDEGLPKGSEPRPRATSREIQRAHVGGARDAESVWAMIGKYDRQYPGCLVKVEQTGGKGGGKPRTFVYFPRREALNAPPIGVTGDTDTERRTRPPDSESAGSDVADPGNIGVTSGDTDPGDTDPGDTDPGPAAAGGTNSEDYWAALVGTAPDSQPDPAEPSPVPPGATQSDAPVLRNVRCPSCRWRFQTAVQPGGQAWCKKCAHTFNVSPERNQS
jgi:Protein of unknown function (DUF3987)